MLLLLKLPVFGHNTDRADTTKLRNLSMDQYKGITSGKKLMIVIFGATWCGPCKKVNPIIEKLCEKYKIKLIHIDVDDNKDLAKAMTAIEIPMVIFYKNGKALMTHLGENSEAGFEKMINEYR